MKLANQKGLSLVEAVTTFMIVGFMAGGFMAILDLNVTETSEGVLSSQLQVQYDNVMEQVSRDIRGATFVLDHAGGEIFENADSYTADKSNVTHIRMYDSDGNLTAGYQVQNSILMELDTATNTWVTYSTGSKQVTVTENSCFNLMGDRKAAQIQLHLTSTYKTANDAISENTNFIHCRN